VSGFADRLMVRYLTDANVDQLLVPAGDSTRARMQQLLGGVYEMRDLTVREVVSVKVDGRQFQAPLVEQPEIRGSWERIHPQSERTLASFATSAFARVTWIGMALDALVEVRVEVTEAALEKVESEDLSDVTSIADLQARFLFVDVNDLMAKSGVTTLQQLKSEFPRLFRLRFAQPPQYNPADPATLRKYRLRVCALFSEDLDLEKMLQTVKAARRASEAAYPHVSDFEGGDLRAGSAWIVVFPTSALTATSPLATEVTALFAADGIVAAFENV
jgi:hypothetical protein